MLADELLERLRIGIGQSGDNLQRRPTVIGHIPNDVGDVHHARRAAGTRPVRLLLGDGRHLVGVLAGVGAQFLGDLACRQMQVHTLVHHDLGPGGEILQFLHDALDLRGIDGAVGADLIQQKLRMFPKILRHQEAPIGEDGGSYRPHRLLVLGARIANVEEAFQALQDADGFKARPLRIDLHFASAGETADGVECDHVATPCFSLFGFRIRPVYTKSGLKLQEEFLPCRRLY